MIILPAFAGYLTCSLVGFHLTTKRGDIEATWEQVHFTHAWAVMMVLAGFFLHWALPWAAK